MCACWEWKWKGDTTGMGQSHYLAPHEKQLPVACRCINRHRSRRRELCIRVVRPLNRAKRKRGGEDNQL